ncbi:hypothetical protein BH09SUM1_BH09SUM1_19200 [soil metagenome]
MQHGHSPTKPSHLFALLLLCFALFLSSCGRDYGHLARYDLTAPGATSLQLNSSQTFLVGANRMNTFRLYRDGKECGETTRTLVRIPTLPETWRTYDGQANWIDFLLKPEGLFMTRAHNEEYKSWIEFPTAVELSPMIMDQNIRHERESPFYTWADTWTTRTGTMAMQVWFAGEESIDTELGHLDRCVRIDSHFDVNLNFGLPFTASMDQRQWVHPDYGEVVRDLDGSFGIVGVPLKSFTSRQAIIGSRRLTDNERLPLEKVAPPTASKKPPARKLFGSRRPQSTRTS